MLSTPVNICNMSPKDFDEFMHSFDYVFSDCDGVLWIKTPLKGVGGFFDYMKKFGKTVKYVTNNSVKTQQQYEKLFKDAGIENGYENLTTPANAIADYLASTDLVKNNKQVYCVTCSETRKTIEAKGIKCKDGPQTPPESYLDYCDFLDEDPEIGAVVFDSDIRINLAKMYKAITYLSKPNVMFINGATDKYWPMKPGVVYIGSGAFTEMVQKEVKREPLVLAKPSKLYGDFVLKRAGVTDPSRVLFIGDMIEQDIRLGKTCGFKTMLVLTTFSEKEAVTNEHVRPDYYAPSLASVVPLLEKYSPIRNGK